MTTDIQKCCKNRNIGFTVPQNRCFIYKFKIIFLLNHYILLLYNSYIISEKVKAIYSERRIFSIRNIAQCHQFSFFTTVDAKICLNLSQVLVKIEQCVCEKVSVKLLKKPLLAR